VLADDIYQTSSEHFPPVTVHMLRSNLGPILCPLFKLVLNMCGKEVSGRTGVISHCEPCRIVLVLAGTELFFFLVAGVVLCFGFGMKIMLITY